MTMIAPEKKIHLFRSRLIWSLNIIIICDTIMKVWMMRFVCRKFVVASVRVRVCVFWIHQKTSEWHLSQINARRLFLIFCALRCALCMCVKWYAHDIQVHCYISVFDNTQEKEPSKRASKMKQSTGSIQIALPICCLSNIYKYRKSVVQTRRYRFAFALWR